jgi:hypothetical protein
MKGGIIYGGIDSSTVYGGEDTWRGNWSSEGETYLTHLQRGTIYGGRLIYGEGGRRGSTEGETHPTSYRRIPQRGGLIYRGGDSSPEEDSYKEGETHLRRGRLVYGGGDPFDGGGLIYRGGGDSSKEGDSSTEGETNPMSDRGVPQRGGTHLLRRRPCHRRRTHPKRGRLIYGGGESPMRVRLVYGGEPSTNNFHQQLLPTANNSIRQPTALNYRIFTTNPLPD